MSSQIQKTIDLMKRSYDQPILFHILHCHLSFLLTKTTPVYEIVDDWSKILIFSSHSNKMPTQGLETKIQSFLHKIKPPVDSKEKSLRLMCICYYLLNRPSNLINHIILFELLNSFLGMGSDYFDGLIISIFSKLVLARLINTEENKKVKADALNRMLYILKERDISDQNKVKALPCFINTQICPIPMKFVEIQPNYQSYKYLEAICLYAKHTTFTEYIKDVLPSDPGFIEELGIFMKSEFEFDCVDSFDLKCCMLQDRSVFSKIREAFDQSPDRQRFLSELVDFITSLK